MRAVRLSWGLFWRILHLGKSLSLEVGDDDEEEITDQWGAPEPSEGAATDGSWGVLFRGGGGKEGDSYFTNQGDACKWGETQSFTERYHPDKEATNCTINLFHGNAVFHSRQVLKCRQKQTPLGRLLVRQRPRQLKQVLVEQREERKEGAEEWLPDVFMEGHSPSQQEQLSIHPSLLLLCSPFSVLPSSQH